MPPMVRERPVAAHRQRGRWTQRVSPVPSYGWNPPEEPVVVDWYRSGQMVETAVGRRGRYRDSPTGLMRQLRDRSPLVWAKGERLPAAKWILLSLAKSGYAPVPSEDSFELAGLLPDGFTLRHSLTVQVWRECGEFVANADGLGVRGFGDTQPDALEYMGEQIVAQYLRLRDLDDRLSLPMQELRERFRHFVAPPNA